ncbi:major coat protein [Vibrio gallaecicus]|uniref:major coat protein n=1 Tax=Vibrio gallaecicus TaxID=552386 RepID=UPI0010C9C329|nr:major coat protein [Vibrio gallaecicus]MDN3617025.1 hypothetical protein [Vibrio gallaecicus]
MKYFKSLRKFATPKRVAVGSIALMVAGSASAALPADAQAALDAIALFVTDLLTGVWPIATALLVGFIGIKLVKKGANKAT